MAYFNIRERRLPFLLRYLADLFAYRHLCWNLVGSDLRTRFRRSRLGIVWALIQPLAFSLMIAAVWGSVFGVADYWQYAVYVFSGLILWEYFATCINVAQDSLINAEGYLRQTRVPFFIFQIRTPLSAFVILLCGFLGLLIMQGSLLRMPPLGLHYLLVPAFFGIFMLFGIPLAALMSVIGTQFRDLRYITGIVVQGLFFISPVMLQRDVLDRPELQWLQYVNPMVPLLDMFRGPVLLGRMWNQEQLVVVGIWIVALWVAALIVQARAGRRLVFAL